MKSTLHLHPLKGYYRFFFLLIFYTLIINGYYQKDSLHPREKGYDKHISHKSLFCCNCGFYKYNTILFDAYEGRFLTLVPKFVKEGTILYIRIKNVNRDFIDNPNITQDQIINPYLEVPAFFSNLTPSAVQAPMDTTKIQKLQKDQSLPPSVNVSKDKEDFLNYYKIFLQNYNELQKILSIKSEGFKEFDFPFIDAEASKDNLLERLKITFKNLDNLADAPRLISTKANEIALDIDSFYMQMTIIFNKLNENQTMNPILLKGELISEKKEKFTIEKAVLLKNQEPQLVAEMNDVKKKYKLLATDSARNVVYSQIQSISDKIRLINQSDFTYKMDPIVIDEDGKSFSFTIKDKQGKVLRQSPVLTIKTKDKFKLDFSAGFFFGSQKNDNYYTQPGKVQFLKPITSDSIIKIDSTVTLVKPGERQPFNFSIGALLNAYYDFGWPVSFGLSFGIAYPVATMPAFTGGISVLLTAKHRLIITVGGSYANTKVLSGENIAYSRNGQMYAIDPAVQLRYDDVYKFGWFVGITYNFAKLVK